MTEPPCTQRFQQFLVHQSAMPDSRRDRLPILDRGQAWPQGRRFVDARGKEFQPGPKALFAPFAIGL